VLSLVQRGLIGWFLGGFGMTLEGAIVLEVTAHAKMWSFIMEQQKDLLFSCLSMCVNFGVANHV
jgi:hypothetical protein